MISSRVVTPVKTGVQNIYKPPKDWIPAFAGMTAKCVLGLFTRSLFFTAGIQVIFQKPAFNVAVKERDLAFGL